MSTSLQDPPVRTGAEPSRARRGVLDGLGRLVVRRRRRVVLGWLVVLVRRARGLPPRPVPAWIGWLGLAVVVAFGVLRNLPAFAWLAP